MTQKTIGDLQVGDRARFTKTITEQDVYAYAGITGDFNPVHVDEAYATTTRFGRRVAHGGLLVGLISTVLGTDSPGPGGIYLGQSLSFRKPAFLGETVTAEVEVVEVLVEKKRVAYKTRCLNQRGEVIAEGESLMLLPS